MRGFKCHWYLHGTYVKRLRIRVAAHRARLPLSSCQTAPKLMCFSNDVGLPEFRPWDGELDRPSLHYIPCAGLFANEKRYIVFGVALINRQKSAKRIRTEARIVIKAAGYDLCDMHDVRFPLRVETVDGQTETTRTKNTIFCLLNDSLFFIWDIACMPMTTRQ